jgi:hypothetical protein
MKMLILSLVLQADTPPVHLFVDPVHGSDVSTCIAQSPCLTVARAVAVIGNSEGLIHQSGKAPIHCHQGHCG